MSSFTSSCSCGKRGYKSEHSAKVANRHARFRLRTYLCQKCREWHVTNMEKR